MKKVLIPIDGSEFSSLAIEKGKEIAKFFGSKIILLHVRDLNFSNYPSDPSVFHDITATIENILAEGDKESAILLEESKKKFEDMFDMVETVSLKGNVASSIVDYAEENDVDLVVLGSNGLGAKGIRGALLGSVANKVIHQVTKPVLLVK
ncbi:universal stress protein [Alkalibacter saccharofermentans]|uniref:Nucleotide-binding universal stress protein, UspA family n=1 Tax=Alkalibacter saccharofermentans DSM 14828 TaxID=1120975 RepID=A0A1M4ZXQ7_9FIRM|nr:universal stress protein [Alkalibacter saccharofermentans]SHF22765.1 Nucleotide-binding universal stress protein, UspA family [Alkalibacter saccharofermentans DSM 14828]